MGVKIKIAVLLCLMSAASYSVVAAYNSLHHTTQAVPEHLQASFISSDKAQYYLKEHDGHVAIYESRRARDPLAVTAIETKILRSADRSLLMQGIPAQDSSQLLILLEDLGS